MLLHFFYSLQARNTPLFIFGWCNIVAAVIFLLLTKLSNVHVRGVNAWLKPFKFALSIAIFSWTMGWYAYELHAPGVIELYNRATIGLLGFEVGYIALQAGKGKASHYNTSSLLFTFLTAFMALAAATVTIWTAYIGMLFCTANFPNLPGYYVLSIRIGISLFVFFAFQGAAMGGRKTHTVGGPESDATLPVLNWSTKYGDLRIAHFIGMHALQAVPLLSWFIFKNEWATAILGLVYGSFAVFTLVHALRGKSLLTAIPLQQW